VVLTDVNPAALDLARVNARANGVACECVEAPGLGELDHAPDLVIANPPFIAGKEGHTYEDGGGSHGLGVSIAWAEEAMRRLETGGRLLLYTGSAIVDGRDPLRDRLTGLAAGLACELTYEEIDPDIFGEELRRPAYAGVERIAAVGAVVRKRGA
jgi:methylase of polypeptide subunit release factors